MKIAERVALIRNKLQPLRDCIELARENEVCAKHGIERPRCGCSALEPGLADDADLALNEILNQLTELLKEESS